MDNETSPTESLNGVARPPNMLDAVDELLQSGIEESHAKAIVRMQYQLIESHLATKKDIADVRKEIAEVRAELKRDIEMVKKDLKIWMGSLAMATLGMLVALAKFGLLTPA